MSNSNLHLAVQNISKSFPQSSAQKVLDGVSFDVHQGKILGIIGKSGAGKSTLLRCLNGLEKPDTGKILFQGQNLTGLSTQTLREIRQKIGVVFQSFNLLTSRTVFENVSLPLELLKLPAAERQKKGPKHFKPSRVIVKTERIPQSTERRPTSARCHRPGPCC
jgi:D-methionine transport system ATP-binding protein